jgi:hypothetical protein
MRKIIEGTAYDTQTAELIVEVGGHEHAPEDMGRLYRTRNGAYFLWFTYLTPGYTVKEDIEPFTDEKAQKWLETNANGLVEKVFGQMPEGGASERRVTLRLPRILAQRLEAISEAENISVNQLVVRTLDKGIGTADQSMRWAKRRFEGADYGPYFDLFEKLLMANPKFYRQFIMVSTKTDEPGVNDMWIGVPDPSFLAEFDGFEGVTESELPKEIDTLLIADATTDQFKTRFRFRRSFR